MAKIRNTGIPLCQFVGSSPLYGIKTGFNEAYLLDTPTKERIVAGNPVAAKLFKPYVRGQDVDRWCAEWAGMWMIEMKSSGNHTWQWSGAGENAESVFQKTYPLIHAHLNQFREKLINRQDQGEYWWELRACAYWDKFAAPKIFYQDITWNQRFSLDTAGTLCNNTVYFLPTDDPWLMAVMNAPIMWWFMWRTAQHGKDEALRLFTDYVNEFPIQTPSDDQRKQAAELVATLWKLARETHESRRAILDWLRTEFAIEKPTQKLANLAGLSPDELVAEVKKIRGRKLPLTVADIRHLKEEHAASIVPMQAKAFEALTLETRLSDLMNEAYGLTPEEVALMWETAPPRMPIAPPKGERE